MHRILSTELTAHIGDRVTVAGWLHNKRRLARLTFLILRDRHGLMQVVVDDDEGMEKVAGYAHESVLSISAVVTAAPQAPGGLELRSPAITVIALSEGPPPIELRRPSLHEQLPTLLDHAAVSLRHPDRRAVFKMAAAATAGFRSTLDGLDFTEIHTPKVVATATESGSNVFGVDYFGRPAFLAQSPQLYKQMMVGVFERVYEVGPVFRAEPHDTARHLAEYVSLDVEMGFIDDHQDVIAVLRSVLAGMMARVAPLVPAPVVPDPFPSIDFRAAQELMGVGPEPDLSPADEQWLGAWTQREFGSDFLVVTGYPMAKRPFYTHPDPLRAEVSNSFDLLFKGQELVTGGQRLHRYSEIASVTPAGLDGYLECFRHGMPPHGGFAIGLERFVSRLVGAPNIRAATLFPRDITRLSP